MMRHMLRTSGQNGSMVNLHGAPWEVANLNKLQPIVGHDQFMQRYSEFCLRWNVSTENSHIRSARKGNCSFKICRMLAPLTAHHSRTPEAGLCKSNTHLHRVEAVLMSHGTNSTCGDRKSQSPHSVCTALGLNALSHVLPCSHLNNPSGDHGEGQGEGPGIRSLLVCTLVTSVRCLRY